MSKAVRRVRTPVFFTPSVARRVDGLVLELGYSRSAIIRAAVDRGLGAAAKDLRRDHENRLRDAGTPPRGRPSEPAPSALLTIEDAVSKLTAFGEGVRIAGERPDADALRDVLHAHARTLPIGPDAFDDAVAEALAMVLSGGADAGDVPGDRDPNFPPD